MTASPASGAPAAHRILSSVPHSAEALALAELLGDSESILYIAVNDRSMDTIAASLAFFAPGVEVLRFPAWDSMPYDRASPKTAIMAERMLTLSRLSDSTETRRIILTTASAALQKLPPKLLMREIVLMLKVGESYAQTKLVELLSRQGYRRAGKAMEPGEFALRGSIVDIVPPGGGEGVRIDFFGDEIESIRPYDVLTQITQGTLHDVSLYPVSEVLLSDKSVECFRTQYRELFGAVAKEDPLYEAVSAQHPYPGMEHWLPLFYDHTDTLMGYAEGALIAFNEEAKQALNERHETIKDYYQARTEALAIGKKASVSASAIYHPLPPERGFLMEREWEQALNARSAVQFTNFLSSPSATHHPPSTHLNFRPIVRASGGTTPLEQLQERSLQARSAGKALLLACFSTGSRERLQHILLEHELHCLRIETWNEVRNISGRTIGLAVLPIESGFETERTIIVSEQDVFGERIIRAAARKKKSELFLLEAANFNEGELVTHKEHGIGRFEGLVTLTVSGAAHDCLKIIYEGDDKLFLPVENIDMVTRFGLEEDGVKLDRLGGASWQSRKAKLKEKLLLAASELLKTAAERMLRPGTVIDTPLSAYDEFCARFPYGETEDQQRAIEETLADLHSGKSMDRLICGDVGFGKTEVALRAAFVAVSGDHKIQVALIVPTTLLARQHYNNFAKRFEGFPVVIRQLSRMVPANQQKKTREELAEGKVDIVIGTHALLSKQVAFKNLGLLIVDEEQHFGVAQKEKLKSMKADVHVLTLSATPIPRTLQMALTGVRDLSLITTPPVDRLAVRSFVMPLDTVVIREAIAREIHRGGHCFVVTPRIKDIAEVKAQLLELMPNLRLAVAHGQLPAAALDDIMNDFYDGKYDALLSTAIIESGLDIPTANTMIIHNAHLLGLAQLYQLRGRVGRGKLRAYAYFLLPHHKQLTKGATRRLEVMQTLDTLGAGFTLASHDMDIRGFGNLVGEEQSGHIREVGIELYQQMLEEAVAQLKNVIPSVAEGSSSTKRSFDSHSLAQDDNKDFSPAINLGLSVLIPESYVDDLPLRLGLYRRAAGLSSEADIESFAAEMIDRFGPLPEETQALVATLGIKVLCKKACIERIDAGPKGAVVSFRNNIFPQPEKLLAYVARNARTLKARPDQKIVFTHEWKNADDKIATLKKLAGEIAALI